MKLDFYITETEIGKSIKEVLRKNNVSARLLLKLKRNNCILLNNTQTSVNNILSFNDIISIILDTPEESDNIVPTKMDLNIIYEDDAYMVLDKPINTAIHPSCLHYDTSLSNGVQYYFNEIGLKKKIRPVNRLDKDTSRYCSVC